MNDKLNTAINKYAVPILASKYTVPILAFVGAIGTTVATCTGSNPQVAGIIGSLLTSVIGNKITNIELINRLKRTSPKNLNHDVLKISGEAVKQTVKWIADSYQEEVKDKLSENELKEIDGKLTEIINDTNSQIDSENWIKELNTKDVINYVNDFNNQVNLTNLSFETIDNLVIDNPFSKFFDEHFQEYFKLYFGELLKQDKCRPALIAYEREIQKMILDAVTQNSDKLAEKIDFTQEEIEKLRKSLDSQEIVSAIRTDIQQYIKELSPQVVSQDIQEDIRREAQKIDSYFKAKKIIIKEIKQDKLLIEIPNKDIIEIGNDYYKLKELTAEIYYFEYNNRLYSI
ncbi:MAG: hypothetical protein LBT04_04190, partial [Prevotellaceae bacterium]|nr:hypothetical protein [Prevotellaceae bacterium]